MTIVFCHWKQHIQQTKDTLASSTLTIHSLYAAKWKLLLIPLFGDISHINFYLDLCSFSLSCVVWQGKIEMCVEILCSV